MNMIIEKLYNKILKAGKKMDKGLVGRTVDKINTDPEVGWIFITTVLLLGGFGVVLCLLWFYLLIKQGMPVGWIIFDTAIVIFCAWAIIKGIIPMSRDCYKIIEDKREKQEKENDGRD